MSRITIRESDLTTPSTTGQSSEVVYVPGFATNDTGSNAYPYGENLKANQGTPMLCSTMADFVSYFGAYPAVFKDAQEYPSKFDSSLIQAYASDSTYMFEANSVDPSYVYAKELINAGIPVLYERINGFDEEPSVEAFYEALEGSDEYDPLANLTDTTEYDIKFITTGGYPSFEYGEGTTFETVVSSEYIKNVNIDKEAFREMFVKKENFVGVHAFNATVVSENTASVVAPDGLTVEVNADTFAQKIGSGTGAYTFTYQTAKYASASPSTEDIAVTYSGTPSKSEGVYTLTCTGTNTWTEGGTSATLSQYGIESITGAVVNDTVDVSISNWVLTDNASSRNPAAPLALYGITISSGSAVASDTIVVTLISNSTTTWTLNDSEVNIYAYGITFSGSPANGDSITVTVSVSSGVNIASKMLSVAATRGDCVALIDPLNLINRPLNASSENSLFYSVSNSASPYQITAGNEYGAMFTPWYNPDYVVSASSTAKKYVGLGIQWYPSAMPGSFAYLMSLAYSVRNNPSWMAIAGVTRGLVPNLSDLSTSFRLTNAIAESYQQDVGISINPITNIRPYGHTIWGNRTLKNNVGGLTATSFLNIRHMISDIKKQAYTAAIACMFEQNTDILWLNFKAYIEPLLEQMTSGYGINDYKIVREDSPSPVKLVATIRIYPVYAVESFDITVELSDEIVSVSDAE